MLLPTINNANVWNEDKNLEGYLNSGPNHSVRVYFALRPEVDYLMFATFVGDDITSIINV